MKKKSKKDSEASEKSSSNKTKKTKTPVDGSSTSVEKKIRKSSSKTTRLRSASDKSELDAFYDEL